MGKILTDLLPFLYHTAPNDIFDYLAALEPSLEYIEGKYSTLTDLVNVDKCPIEYLSYLADTVNAPLIGGNPSLWRNQIKQWPEILRIKGTEKSIKLFLSVMGFSRSDIKTYWRDEKGDYVTDKPEGLPFKGADGIWYNSRTHYFSLALHWTDGSAVGSEPDSDTLEFVKRWLPRVKPIYAEILAYEVAFSISEFYDNLEDSFSAILSPQLSDTVPLDDGEQFSAVIQPFFNESPWFRHYYGEENLFYDGKIRYDSQDEEVEFMKARMASQIKDVVESRERTITTIKIIV